MAVPFIPLAWVIVIALVVNNRRQAVRLKDFATQLSNQRWQVTAVRPQTHDRLGNLLHHPNQLIVLETVGGWRQVTLLTNSYRHPNFDVAVGDTVEFRIADCPSLWPTLEDYLQVKSLESQSEPVG